MAGKREIKTTLKLEGEQQFKRAMSDATTSLRELDSEQRLAEAQFKATGDAQAYMAEKSRILQQKIAEQQKVVDAGEEALAEMKAKGIDPSNKAFVTMMTRVNNAKTKLVQMQGSLDDNERELKEQSTQLDATSGDVIEYGSAMEDIDKKITLENAINAVGRLKEHLGAVIKAIWNTGKAIVELEVQGGEWADELATTASQMGVDVETLQRWRYASRFIDTEVDTIATSMQRLNAKTGDTFAETANMIGLPINGYKTQADFFWAAVDAFHNQMEAGRMTEKELDDAAQVLFGRSFRDLKPLIEAGSAAYLELGDSAQVVSAEQVAALGAFDDARQDLEHNLDVTKYEFLASLAPTFTEVANSLSSVVKSFNEFLASEAGQKALNGLNEALAGLIAEFTGEQNFEGLVDAAAAAVKKLTDGLSWIKENSSFVSGGLWALVGAFGALTVAEPVLTFLQLLSSTNLTRKLKQLGVANGAVNGARVASGAGGAGAGASGAGAAAAGGAAKAGILGKFGTWLGGVLAGGAAGPLAGIALGSAAGIALDKAYTSRNYGKANAVFEYADQIMGQADQGGETMSEYAKMFARMTELYDKSDVEAMQEAYDLIEGNRDFFDRYINQMSRNEWRTDLRRNDDGSIWGADLNTEVGPAMAEIYELMAADVENYAQDMAEAAQAVDPADYETQRKAISWIYSILKGIIPTSDMDNTGILAQAFGDDWRQKYGMLAPMTNNWDYVSSTLGTMKADLEAEMTAAGLDATTGFTTALDPAAASEAGAAMGQGAADGAKGALDENSPSKVMFDIGQNAAIGLANGINAQLATVQTAAANLANAVSAIVRARLAIHSPSAVMAGLGEYTAQGFAEGIGGSVWRVEDAMDKMIGATQRRPVYPSGGYAAGGAQTGAGGMINATIVMDKEIVGAMLAPVVDGEIGATISARR